MSSELRVLTTNGRIIFLLHFFSLIRTRPRVKQQQQELTDIYENLSLHSSSGGRGAVIPNCKTLDSESNDYEPLDSINPVFVAYEKDDKQPRG